MKLEQEDWGKEPKFKTSAEAIEYMNLQIKVYEHKAHPDTYRRYVLSILKWVENLTLPEKMLIEEVDQLNRSLRKYEDQCWQEHIKETQATSETMNET